MFSFNRYSNLYWTGLFAIAVIGSVLVVSTVVTGQVSGGTDVNPTKRAGDDSECAIAKNPTNKNQLFLLSNTSGAGLFAARSTDMGVTWSYPDAGDKTIADGDVGQGPAACCDPSLAWDTFGNLFITYLDAGGSDGIPDNVVTILSTDGGLTFTNLATFGPANVDQPTVVVANTSAPGAPVAVWVVWNQGGQMVARGAAVTGLNAVGAFGPLQTIPGTANSSFGDIAISPSGAVVQVSQNPTGGQGPATLLVNTDADGIGAGNFGPTVTATTTNVGGFDFIPAQNARSVDAEAGLAYDSNPASPHFGRLYLVYTDEVVNESNDTDIMLRFSDNDGATWSAPIRVNDDGPGRSQFLPKIAVNPLSGNIAISWHDCRNSGANTAMQVFCSIATPTGASPVFFANAQISDGASTSTGTANPNQAVMDFGDYSGLAYFQGRAHPAWGDTSNSTGDNPNGTGRYDAYTDIVSGGAAAMEGDPHITTVDGIHYDFQGAGEFVSLRDTGGLEIQTRQTPVATASAIANGYTGLTTCVSLNTAVAARVGRHRVTFQPNLSGVPDPSGLQLRVDGNLRTLTPNGINLGSGGRVAPSIGGGIEIDFPDDTVLVVTPGWWSSQSKWYLNVNVFHTPALEGIMGARAPGSWLPALSDGTSLGPRPAALHQRFIDLYETFANSWRVTDKTSLFDYAPGTSTGDFTIENWPHENGPCDLPQAIPVKPMKATQARELSKVILDKSRNANCVFDLTVTGNPGFVKTYLLSQQIQAGSTMIVVTDNVDPTKPSASVTFTATVAQNGRVTRGKLGDRGAPRGTIQFSVDGKATGARLKLDSHGQARWTTSRLKVGNHRIAAKFTPSKGSAFLTSNSVDELHAVRVLRR